MYGEARTIQIVLAERNDYPAVYEPTDGLQSVGVQRISPTNRKQKLGNCKMTLERKKNLMWWSQLCFHCKRNGLKTALRKNLACSIETLETFCAQKPCNRFVKVLYEGGRGILEQKLGKRLSISDKSVRIQTASMQCILDLKSQSSFVRLINVLRKDIFT